VDGVGVPGEGGAQRTGGQVPQADGFVAARGDGNGLSVDGGAGYGVDGVVCPVRWRAAYRWSGSHRRMVSSRLAVTAMGCPSTVVQATAWTASVCPVEGGAQRNGGQVPDTHGPVHACAHRNLSAVYFGAGNGIDPRGVPGERATRHAGSQVPDTHGPVPA